MGEEKHPDEGLSPDEINALVAEHVMGWEWVPSLGAWDETRKNASVVSHRHFWPTTAPGDIQRVQDRMLELGYSLVCGSGVHYTSPDLGDGLCSLSESRSHYERICIAALRAVGVEVPKKEGGRDE